MDTEQLLAAGENLRIEFKSQINDDELTKAVTCLANGEGGTLFVGVNDDGTVVGAKPRHKGGTSPDRIAALIQNKTEPALAVEVSVETVNGCEVIRIDVPRADPAPVGTKDGTFTRRTIGTDGRPQCMPMTVHEIVSLGMVTRGQDYAEAAAPGATFDDLDPGEFDRLRSLCRMSDPGLSRMSDRDILAALGLIARTDHISLGAILLFGMQKAVERWLPTAEVLFQDLRPDGPPINRRIVAPLLQVADELGRLLDERNRTTELLVGLYRVDLPLIPEVTRREAIANALVHRDYAALGPVVVQISDSAFTVSNPGGFPPGVTIDNILNQSRPRSPILANAFKRAGLVERRGKGVLGSPLNRSYAGDGVSCLDRRSAALAPSSCGVPPLIQRNALQNRASHNRTRAPSFAKIIRVVCDSG